MQRALTRLRPAFILDRSDSSRASLRDPVPSLFIDGQWVASGDGTCSPVVNPSDGSVVTEVDVATDDAGPGGHRRRPPRLRRDRLAAHPHRRASRAPRPRRRPPRPRPRGARHRPRPRTPARPCARAAGTSPTSPGSSATTPSSRTRRPTAVSVDAEQPRTRSAASSTSPSACAGSSRRGTTRSSS